MPQLDLAVPASFIEEARATAQGTRTVTDWDRFRARLEVEAARAGEEDYRRMTGEKRAA